MDKPVTFATTLGTGAAVQGTNVVAWVHYRGWGDSASIFEPLQES